MALSLVSSAHSSYSDLQTFFDNSRFGLDFSNIFHDQMEYNNNTLQSTHPPRNFLEGQHVAPSYASRIFSEFNDQLISFVDSPPNSKGSWSEDQGEGSPKIIDVQTICSNNTNKRRRMDWESLDISQGATNASKITSNRTENSCSPKALNICNNNSSVSQTSTAVDLQQQSKDRIFNERKKKHCNVTGRGNWSEDIDFGDFDNSSYLNNEAFLAFNQPLGLKQEIPSPQTSCTKSSNKNPAERFNSTQNGSNINEERNQSINTQPNKHYGRETQNSTIAAVQDSLEQLIPTNTVISNNSNVQDSPRKQPDGKTKNDLAADDFKFQYILAAATSTATKNNEETLTYMNQGQSYEIKLKKTGDLSFYRDKVLRSVIKICFHERRLQYMERVQMQQWQASRPGERIIEVDIPLSYGLCSAFQPTNPNQLNTVEIYWDPMKEVGVYIKVNCISTEFTPKKHGGEKGVPFRIQIETFIESSSSDIYSGTSSNTSNNSHLTTNSVQQLNTHNKLTPVHAAACQIKVFKLKGADRKHKQDKEKIQRRPPAEQEKYQPSYECTILNDISLDILSSTPRCYSPEYFGKLWPNSPVHIAKYDGIFSTPSTSTNSSPIAINCVTSSNPSNLKIIECSMVSSPQTEMEESVATISRESTPGQIAKWLIFHRLNTYVPTFAQYFGADVFRMSKEDLIQICGLGDGIRMYNIIHSNQETKQTLYISFDGCNFHAIYLKTANVKELVQKLVKLPGFFEFCSNADKFKGNGNSDVNGFSYGLHSKYSESGSNIYDGTKITIYLKGPSGVHVLVTDEVLVNEIADKSPYVLEIQNGRVLMKLMKKIEN